MSNLKGIKGRLVGSYIFIIAVTVAILEVFLILTISQYYYKNIENMLSRQIKVSVDFYNSYLSSSSLKKNIQDNADIFWKNTSAEVQIIDSSREMLMDSIGNFTSGKVNGDDITKALNGELGSSIEIDKRTKEKVLYVSYPLKSSNKIEGVLRFVTSLNEVDKTIGKISILFISIGAIVILIVGAVSVSISNTIIKPLDQITHMAIKMASGRFNEKITKTGEDEIGELCDTLNYMSDEILKNEKLKNEFIASVSHELRTPLTSIKGWALTIRTGDLEDKQEILDGLEIIEKESDRLTLLVEELLDFSKFISGKVVLKRDYVDIKNTLEYIRKQMEPRALRHDINFTINVEEKLPLLIIDENRMKQVFINLLDNAFKFTPEQGSVELKVENEEENVLITVKDSGIGIPKDELPRVTEKFFKGNNSMSSNGIGLSICNEIVSLHGGTLEISSEVQKGTQVFIRIPASMFEKNLN